MNVKFFCLPIALILALTLSFAGCGSDDDDSTGTGGEVTLSSSIYSGADPKGDFIAIEIDGTAQTVTHYNYTPDPDNPVIHGPYSYSRVTNTDINGGFSNMYITEELDDVPNTYAVFIIVNGVAIIYQLLDNNYSSIDTPGYAFVRKDMNTLSEYEETAYNWIKFQMGGNEGNFEAGFAAFDSGDGTFYGASYNNRADNADGVSPYDYCDANGISNINSEGTLNLDVFDYNASNMSHTYGDLTLIPNENDDCVLDFGEDNGAGFAIRQADTKNWQTAYNGTYLMMVYCNDDSGDEQEVSPMKLVLSTSTTVTNAGHFIVYNHGESEVQMQGDFGPAADLDKDHSPGGSDPLIDQLEVASNCGSAESSVVNNAYNVYGGFVAQPGEGNTVLFLMMDPDGNYLFFTMFQEDGGNYNYAFGFGVKDS